MPSPKSIYTKKIARFEQELKNAKQQLLVSSMLRLTVFVAVVCVAIFLWGHTRLVAVGILIGIVLFFVLVSRHLKLQSERDRLKALIAINRTEIRVLNREFSDLPNGKKYKNPSHDFSDDIDLFGDGSFFQYINRTALEDGEAQLTALLTENSTDGIEAKQKAIAELGENIDFRQEFSALATLAASEKTSRDSSVKINLVRLANHRFFTPKYAKPLSTVFSILSIVVIIAFFLDFLSWKPLLGWLLLGVVITGFYIKRVNALSETVGKMQQIFRQYHKLLSLLEKTSFSTELLRKQQDRIAAESESASAILKKFSRAIDELDQRNNLLFGFFGNGFLLWDLRMAATLENWIKTYSEKAAEWFAVIALMDAYNSLGNFAFNHPEYNFPKITASNTIIKAENAVHPLIKPEEAVTNSFHIDKGRFFIITGANMAGKSTFLRTVALQIAMSNVGLPVSASNCTYTPIKLISSMRTSDSLAEEASYFYAELSRLKFIIDKLKTGNYFIVLDEILKGTNSTDKAIGSRKFLEKLVSFHASGIIATHDLSLCDVAEKLPQVENHFFDAQIIADELYFDYKFKDGICQNMNASFLLKKMKIVDD